MSGMEMTRRNGYALLWLALLLTAIASADPPGTTHREAGFGRVRLAHCSRCGEALSVSAVAAAGPDFASRGDGTLEFRRHLQNVR